VKLMVDFNQALTVAEAIRRGRMIDEEGGVTGSRSRSAPTISAGCARIAREVDTPIQIGENFMGPEQMAQALAAGACDYVMPDAQRIGGVTGWMRAAALAQGAGWRCRATFSPKRAATCSPRRRPATGSSTSTGPTRYSRTPAGKGRLASVSDRPGTGDRVGREGRQETV
jgi:hypothetical protein